MCSSDLKGAGGTGADSARAKSKPNSKGMGLRFADDPVDTSPKKKSSGSAERKKGSVGFADEVVVDPGTLEDNFQEKGTRVNTDDMLISASSSVDHSVGFELTLDDMTPATFTEDKQTAFAADLAKSLGLEPHQVEITGFTAGSLVIHTHHRHQGRPGGEGHGHGR